MPVSILALFVIVIDRPCTRPCTRANERTFPAADQCACPCTDGGTDADALRGLLFSGLRISITSSVLAACDGNSESEREQQQQN